MSSLIKKAHEIEVPKMLKVLLYGQPGLGKSTLALSAPRPLLFDFDGGVHRVADAHRADTVQVRSWDDVLNVLDNEDLSGYDTIIYDTAAKMLDFVGQFIIEKNPKMGRNGNLTLQGYGERKTIFRNHFHRLATMGKKMIVFVAHDKEEKRGDETVVRPEVGGSSAGDLIRELDLVGYMEAVGKKRTISFDPCEKFYGKNTCGLPPLIDIPDLSKPGTPNNFLTGLVERHNEAARDREEKGAEYAELMNGIREFIESVSDADGANDAVARMKDADHVWDSKIQAAALLRDRCKVLGLTFDKDAGKYKAGADV